MTYRVEIKDLVAQYPYKINLGYSPCSTWDRLVLSDGDPRMLSPFMKREWASADIAAVPALVGSPPLACDAEIADLFALKALREPLKQQIEAEARPGWGLHTMLLERLAEAGVDMGQPLGGRTAGEVLAELCDLASNDAKCLVVNQKALFNRQRPWQAAPGIHPMFVPGHPSYPSGHSTTSHALAWTLGLVLAPTRYRALGIAFSDCASGVAQRREIAGVHYRSDTVAGMALARFIVDRYEQSAEFRRKYTDVIGAMR